MALWAKRLELTMSFWGTIPLVIVALIPFQIFNREGCLENHFI